MLPLYEYSIKFIYENNKFCQLFPQNDELRYNKRALKKQLKKDMYDFLEKLDYDLTNPIKKIKIIKHKIEYDTFFQKIDSFIIKK